MEADKWQVFFFPDPSGEKPVKNYINNLTPIEQAGIRHRIKLLKDFGPFQLDVSQVKYLRNKIWELRITGDNHHRILWFIYKKRKIILLHAFLKKSSKIPEKDIDKALARKNYFIRKYGGD